MDSCPAHGLHDGSGSMIIGSKYHVFTAILLLLISTEGISGEMGLLNTLSSPGELRGGAFGFSMDTLDDINEDEYAELVVAAIGESLQTEPRCAGRVYILDGSTTRALHELSSPNPTEFGHFGLSVSSIGDITNDGIGDILVSTPWEYPGESPQFSGRAYAFDGMNGSLLHEMISPTETASGQFGLIIAGLTDVDGDDCPDIAIGAPQENPDPSYERSGAVHVFSGASGNHLRYFLSPNIQTGGGFGFSVAPIQDINCDGTEDIVVGAPYEDGEVSSYTGRAYVISGVDDQTLLSLLSPVERIEELFGWSVAALGDVNDDNVPDIIVGAPEIAEGGAIRYGEGAAYVYSGADGDHIFTLSSPNPQNEGHFGSRVKCCGDMNNDGVPDIIVCADSENPGAGQTSGRLYIFSGATGDLIYTLTSPNAEAGGHFGMDAVCRGDNDGDGRYELIVGAPYENPGLSPLGCGRLYEFTQGLKLTASTDEGTILLSWTPIVPAYAYWLYGSADNSFFVPELESPYLYRLDVLSPGFDSINRVDGINDPAFNWTYQLIAVDRFGYEIESSNRVGEFDFAFTPPGW